MQNGEGIFCLFLKGFSVIFFDEKLAFFHGYSRKKNYLCSKIKMLKP